MSVLIRVQTVTAVAFDDTGVTGRPRTGVDAIDCSVRLDDQITGDGAAEIVRRCAGRARDGGLRLASVTLAPRADRSVVPAESALPVVEAAAAVGASVCHLVTSPHPASYRDALNEAYQTITALSLPAERCGVVAALCAPGRGLLLSPVEVCDLIDTAHEPGAGVCVNLDALASTGRLSDWLTILGRRVASVSGSAEGLCEHADALNRFGAERNVLVIER